MLFVYKKCKGMTLRKKDQKKAYLKTRDKMNQKVRDNKRQNS